MKDDAFCCITRMQLEEKIVILLDGPNEITKVKLDLGDFARAITGCVVAAKIEVKPKDKAGKKHE